MKLSNKPTVSIAFLMTFICLGCKTSHDNSAIVSYRTTPNELDCINYIIAKDDSLGKVRNHACESRSLSKTIEDYVNAVDNLNFTHCPEGFSQAFENHMKAWTGMKKVTDEFPKLRGEMHDLFDMIAKSDQKEEFEPLLKAIWDTWAEVENAQKKAKRFTVTYEIKENDLVPEGIAYNDRDRSFYIGSTWKRKVVKIDSVGNVSNFVESGQDGLLGVIGMKVDVQRQVLWLCTSSAGKGMPVQGLTELEHNKSGIFKYDLRTKTLMDQYWLEETGRSFFFNDLTIDKEGRVYATEMQTSSIYTIAPDAGILELFYSLPEGYTANGIDIDEKNNTLFLALYAKPNAFGKIDIATKKFDIISLPNDEQVGADGLYFHNNSLIAVQPFTKNRSVTQYFLDKNSESVERLLVLLPDDKILHQPTTGTIVKDEFYFIANSQLQKFSRLWKENNGKVDSSLLEPIKIIKMDL